MILGFTVTRLVLLPTSLLTFPVVGGRLHLKFGRKTIFKIQLEKKVGTHTYTHIQIHVITAILRDKIFAVKRSSEFISFPFKTI